MYEPTVLRPPSSDCTSATLRHISQHHRKINRVVSPDTDKFPLPPNALPTLPFLSQPAHLNNSDLLNRNATIHDFSSLFRDLSAHPPIASALHESADQVAARLRVLLVQERYQSEHMSTVLHGNPSVPNLLSQSPNRFSIGHPLGSYLPPRRMVSQPSPMRTPDHSAPVLHVINKLGDSRHSVPSGHIMKNVRNL